MAVKMLTSMAGADFSVSPGDIFNGDPAHEARLIAAGLAEAATPEPKAAPKKGK